MKKIIILSALLVSFWSAKLQAKTPVEQVVRIMMSNTDRHEYSYSLAQKRNPNDYQDLYNLATKHQALLKGVIHNGRTFAMLCVERGHADLLERLINETWPVDLVTPCNLLGSDEPQTTVLHELLSEVSKMRTHKHWPEDYSARITKLTKLIINNYPELLDIPVNRQKTAHNYAYCRGNINDLIHNVPKFPLLAACQKGDYHAVERMLATPGTDVNQADNNGDTPLLVACRNNTANLNIRIIDALLKKGAVNKANKKGETPLEIVKGTQIYGLLEFYLVGEVRASKWCSALSKEEIGRTMSGSKQK